MEEFRSLTEQSIGNALDRIKNNYMQIYDHYYSKERTMADVFLKDLVDCLDYLNAVLNVYTEKYNIYPQYAIEKLTAMKNSIDAVIGYFEQEERKVEYERENS